MERILAIVLMSLVVCRIRPLINSAYKKFADVLDVARKEERDRAAGADSEAIRNET